MVNYQIWHDNDFDAAAWFFENLNFPHGDSVSLRQIPKTNKPKDLLRHLTSDRDLSLLPVIRFETPDLVLVRERSSGSEPEILLVVELMTHTPQHDHPLQRFSRLYNSALLGVPSFLVLPAEKEKLERGTRLNYKAVNYRINPLAYHLFTETTMKFGVDALLIEWPTRAGYLKYDRAHPTAPRVEGQIVRLFAYAQALIDETETATIGAELLDRMKKKGNYKGPSSVSSYSLTSVFEVPTDKVLSANNVLTAPEARIGSREMSIVYTPNGLKSGQNDFRTDPYAGKLCAFDVLFCRDDGGVRIRNLILRANGVQKSSGGSLALKAELHDSSTCPFIDPTTISRAELHWKQFCPYVERKQQRVFGEVPDLIIFDGGDLYEPKFN